MMDFFCRKCNLDQTRETRIRNRYAFEARCEKCGEDLIRYRENIKDDPYYQLSPKIQRECFQYRNDLIQPYDADFRIFYKTQWEKFEKQKEEAEKKEKEKEKSLKDLYKSITHKMIDGGLIDKVLKLEDRLTQHG